MLGYLEDLDMGIDNESNMRVINEAYEQMLTSDNLIMSDDLLERMRPSIPDGLIPNNADSHELYISSLSDALSIANISGSLNAISQSDISEMTISFEITNITQEILKKIYTAVSNKEKVNLKLIGMGGFACESTSIKQWDLTKIAPHQLLLSLTFEGSNVTF
jgi:hypothetical protein